MEKQIYDILVNHCGAVDKVKGISGVQLSKFRNSKASLTVRKLKSILEENGMSGKITIYGNGTKTEINFFD